ncbi:insulin-degrading enzyme [Nannochloropsis gaditana]|uniref:Insulin-degrading enzyme n=1 Tax=Nannochloropsis gaditana TaxID=72520 RepID=W7TWY2_9STRA|nr:insulin-degrading enzyme [Nannochloropsis gaditana]
MGKDLGRIEQSPADDRTYRALELENGLQVLLIHDPTTDKASAAMSVGVGSLHDGDVEGLAHFCEHMLFLGTEKYPDEQAYSKYLNQNGGHSNAYTDMDHTCYFFSVLPGFLEGALDRFAQFFISPLFTDSATAREMQAVDSENNKNLQNDAWRLHQIHCASAKPGHPLGRFRCGSLRHSWRIPRPGVWTFATACSAFMPPTTAATSAGSWCSGENP